jgi:gliding motility-associated-like protein
MVEVIDCNCPDTPQFQDPPTLCNDGQPFDLNDLFVGPSFDGSWDVVTQPPGGNLVINADNTVTIGGMVEGDYILMFTLSTDPGPDCPTEFTLNPLVINEQPTAGNDGFTTLCMGDPDSYILIDLLDGEDNGGVWTDISIDGPSAGSFDALAGTFDASGESPGTYTFQYEIVPDPPCNPVVAIVEVVVEDLPVVDAGQQQMLTCDNNEAELGDPTGTIQGAGVTYEWTEMSDPTTVIGTDLEISVSQGGTYVLTVIDQNGCINTDMVFVDAAGNIPSYETASTDIPCFGDSNGTLSFINVQGGDGNYQYSIDGGQSFSSQTTYNNLMPGVYDLVLVDGDGCEIPDQVVISEPSLLTADAGDDQAIILGTANTMSVTVPGVDPSIITSVVWTDNDGNIVCEGTWDDCNTIEVNTTTTTTYTVTVETETGCRASDNIRLNIAVVMDCFVPNIFSTESTDPNNTFFFMTCDEFAEAITEFYIYDRWGNLVFTAEDIQPNDPSVGWDGKFNGSSVEQGVYVYLIKVKFFDVPDLEIYAGDLTVVR